MKRNRFIQSVRAQAALTAYSTALDWFQRLPAAEVERRLVAMIAQKQREYGESTDGAAAAGSGTAGRANTDGT